MNLIAEEIGRTKEERNKKNFNRKKLNFIRMVHGKEDSLLNSGTPVVHLDEDKVKRAKVKAVVVQGGSLTYRIQYLNGKERAVDKSQLMTEELYQRVYANPTVSVLESDKGKMTMSVFFKHYAMYCPCQKLGDLNDSYRKLKGYSFLSETMEENINGDNFEFEPCEECHLLEDTDCARRLAQLITRAPSWSEARKLIEIAGTGRMIVYKNSDPRIKTDEDIRDPDIWYLRFVDGDLWIRTRTKVFGDLSIIDGFFEAVRNYHKDTGIGIPEFQFPRIKEAVEEAVEMLGGDVEEYLEELETLPVQVLNT